VNLAPQELVMPDDAASLTSKDDATCVPSTEAPQGNLAPKKPRAPRKTRTQPAPTSAKLTDSPKPARKGRAPASGKSAPSKSPTTLPTVEEVAALEANIVRLTESLQAARADADEFQSRQDDLQSRLTDLDGRGRSLQNSLTPVEQSLADLERRAAALQDVSPVLKRFDELTKKSELLTERIRDAQRQMEAQEQSQQTSQGEWESLKKESATIQPVLQSASQTIADAERRASEVKNVAEESSRKLEELVHEKEEMERSVDSLRRERGMLSQIIAALHEDAQRSVEAFRKDLKEVTDGFLDPQSLIDSAKLPMSISESQGERSHANIARRAAAEESSLPEVQTLPPDSLADDVEQQLLRYLNDARTVAQEQASLLEDLLENSHDAWSQVELQRAATEADQRREAVEERIVALGGEPSGGRGLLSHVATYIWDVLQKPADAQTDPIDDLLKALCAVELEIGVYVALNALSRAIGDQTTAALAAAHHAEAHDVAHRLRAQITVPAVESASRRSEMASR
jgi:predicted nuclease with TOPRIM domain